MNYDQLKKQLLVIKNLWKTIYNDVLLIEKSLQSISPFLIIANPNYKTEMDKKDRLLENDPFLKDDFRNMQIDIDSDILQKSKWLFTENEVSDFNIEVRFRVLEPAAIRAVKHHPSIKEISLNKLGNESVNVILFEYRRGI